MASYIALLRKDADSDYGVEFPDFPGCVTAGGTLDEASARAAEALAGHIGCMIEDGDAIPEPGTLDAVMSDPDSGGAIPFLVTVPGVKPRALRVNVTIAEDLLAEIDKYAESRGLTRSGFLARAAKRAIVET